MKDIAIKYNYCPNVKEYKENTSKYKEIIIDISMIIRVAITSKSMTPDLYDINKIINLINYFILLIIMLLCL